MSFVPRSRPFQSLTARLALWYAALFALMSFTLFVAIYILLKNNIRKRADDLLAAQAGELAALIRVQGLNAGKLIVEGADGVGATVERLLTRDGRIIASDDPVRWRGVEVNVGRISALPGTGMVYETRLTSSRKERMRVGSVRVGDDYVLQVGESLQESDRVLSSYREATVTLSVAVLLIATAVGWFTARKAVRGIDQIAETAMRIGEGDLSLRVPRRGNGDEVDKLAAAFNNMVTRIQSLIGELKDVTDNIAHDLRSPIVRMRGTAETALSAGGESDACRELAGDMIEDCDRLVGIINTMLEITETESGIANLRREPVDLDDVVHDAAEIFRPVAADKGVELRLAPAGGDAVVNGDKGRLQRVIANLLDNAIKYTPAHGSVGLEVSAAPDEVTVAIKDTGIGISAADLPHIFDRFYRVDRSRSLPGNGLGLSLAGALVKAHGGRIDVRSQMGRGSTFTVCLPRLT